MEPDDTTGLPPENANPDAEGDAAPADKHIPPPKREGSTLDGADDAVLLMNGAGVTGDLISAGVEGAAEVASGAGEVLSGAVDALGSAADAIGGVVEGAGNVLEGASGCLDGCSGCSLALLVTLFVAAGTAWAMFN